jgi:hypothetical protein
VRDPERRREVSEVIPEDEDRGDEGAIGSETSETPVPDEPEVAIDEEGGTGTDDGGPGSRNM